VRDRRILLLAIFVCPMQCICIARKRPYTRPSCVCRHDCDLIYGPIFTKFRTYCSFPVSYKGFLISSIRSSIYTTSDQTD